ncbi:hypothetical protein DL766_009348 [Monosporascus sp. MC13-8B]|uniref:Myb-like domain-containing protein n=1 Tax=Monosporascus cannonballus TaxID=155416 RepID=A0ABY0GXL1_9PEZI|nr:hypothetical protein DL762_008145 [Monosporascus cannonballus]RYO87580.1 hypothetical protein DL763_006281 [Monosporascus cannonballus]RYP15655.1 hypothetical protein DL766_009348 [Monosporascus sp. MC13-8B]
MANITLDTQTFFNPFGAVDPEPRRYASVASFEASSGCQTSPQEDEAHDPQPSAAGASKDDAILISDDDDSDYGDCDDGQSDVSFPPIHELLASANRMAVQSSDTPDLGPSRASDATNNSDAAELPFTAGVAEPDQETASPLSGALRHSTAPASPARPSSSFLAPQTDPDSPICASNASDGDSYGNPRDGSDDEDYYQPPIEGSEGEQDKEEDDNGVRPTPRKRSKINSPTHATLNSTFAQRLRPRGHISQTRKFQTPARNRGRPRRQTIPSPPSSHTSHNDQGSAEPAFAKFEEWPLENACLKRVTENGVTTFQLQFSWDSSEEDNLLIELKRRELSWQETYEQFTEKFPGRSKGTLQVRYCTKLKGGARIRSAVHRSGLSRPEVRHSK